MRITSLDWIAFGPFTNSRLELGEAPAGLQIIFGPNEAGKSSSLRGIADLLFGFHARTDDDFIHPYNKLRLGATLLHSDGSILKFVRRKGTQNTLRDETDSEPIADSALKPFLGNVDRAMFTTMFGIDHERLRSGGEDLVRGGGQIGEALFASASGMSALRSVKARLADSLQTLYKARGPAGTLGLKVNALKEARDARKRSLKSSDDWEQGKKRMDEAATRRNELDRLIRDKKTELQHKKRLLQSIPIVAQWKGEHEKWSTLQHTPLLDEDFGKRAQQLLSDWRHWNRALEQLRQGADRTKERLDRIPIDFPILECRQQIESLTQNLGTYQKFQQDIPRVQGMQNNELHGIREVLREIGRSPENVDIPLFLSIQARLPNIQELGTQRDGFAERLRGSRSEVEKLQKQIASAQQKLDSESLPLDTRLLRNKLRQLQRLGDLDSQRQQAREEVAQAERTLRTFATELLPWKGDIESLLQSNIPTSFDIDRMEESLHELESERKRLESKLRDSRSEEEDHRRELAVLEAVQAVPTLEQLAKARAMRDTGWSLVRQEWLEGGADPDQVQQFVQDESSASSLANAMEESIANADQIADRIYSDAERVATKARLQIELEENARQQQGIEKELESLRESLAAWQTEWELLWVAMGCKPKTPKEMRNWLQRFQELRRQARSLADARQKLLELESSYRNHQSELIELLTPFSPSLHEGAELADWIAMGVEIEEEHRNREEKRKQLQEALEQDRSSLEQSQIHWKVSQSDWDAWERSWHSEMKALGLDQDTSPVVAHQFLQKVSKLLNHHKEGEGFRQRIHGMQRDAKLFLDALNSVSERFFDDVSELTPEDRLSMLTRQLREAEQAQSDRKGCEEESRRLQQEIEEAKQKVAELQGDLDYLLQISQQREYEELSVAAEQSMKRRQAEQALQGYEKSLCAAAGTNQFLPFTEEVQNAAEHQDQLNPEIEYLEKEIARMEEERDSKQAEYYDAKSQLDRLVEQDDALTHSLESESIAASIEEDFRELLILRLCDDVLTRGIDRYQDKNQAPILAAASKYFSEMTLHAFRGLRAEWNDAGQAVIAGIRADGSELHVEQMSDGTCDQLYLALRLASLDGWLENHEPIPFIVDDILVHFDDERSKATLQVLAKLSERTQTIFFTHHQHLVDLAKETIPSNLVFVHELCGD